MARGDTIQTNLTAGELSPRIALGRADVAKYQNGSRRQENVALTVQGGARRRPGTRFVAEVKGSGPARLVDFVFSRDQAYVIEMGAGYLRFVRDRAQILQSGAPYEIPSPYSAGQRREVRYAQKSDTGFFAHQAVYPQRLQRFSDTQWLISAVPFSTEPASEQGTTPAVGLTLGSSGLGSTTATASAAAFSIIDVGREIESAAGRGAITAFTSPTVVAVTVVTPFPATALAAGAWKISGSPQAFLRASTKEPVGATAKLTMALPVGATLNLGQKETGVTTATTGGAAFAPGDVGRLIYADTGVAAITAYTSATEVAVKVNVAFLDDSYAANGWGMTISAFQASDVGKTVALNGGVYKIISQTGDAARSTILIPATAVIAAPPNAWVLASPSWNAGNGYPRAVALNGQRLLYAATPAQPQYLWGSFVADVLDFAKGTEDDQGFAFELDGARNSPIQHLVPSRRLLALTDLDEMSVAGGGVEKTVITPTNVQKTDESSAGATYVRPLKAGNEILFVQAAGKKVHAIGYRYEIDGFNSPDRTIFAEHITGPGIVEMAYQKTPDPMLFCVRNDGVLAVCAYDMDQEVVGWGRWITQGNFESVTNVPTSTAEDAYVIVARTVGGVTRRYIEVFDETAMLDSCVIASDVDGKATWGGLVHLEGLKVQVNADGNYLGEFVVSSAAITLPRAAKVVQIGLGYTALVETLQVELGQGGSTSQGSQINCTEVILRTLNTKAIVFNGDTIDPRKFGPDLLDQPIPDFDGDVRVASFTDDIYRVKQVITQPYPLPFHLLNIIRRVTVN